MAYKTGEYYKGIEAAKHAIRIREKMGNPALVAEAYQQLAQSYHLQGDGPQSLKAAQQSLAIAEELEGQLTATLHMNSSDHGEAAKLVPILEQRAGRIIANAWPTGVDVTHAMVHGGPFPATSDGRSTSVGTLAIDRFLRPVSYQDMPAALLPKALLDGTSTVLRRVDGTYGN